MTNVINWFEIPASDIERAVKFYSTIFEAELEIREMMPGVSMAMFPVDEGGVGGGVIQAEGYVPSAEGIVVYLNGGEDLSTVLGRVEGAGGKVQIPKTDIGEPGFMAMFFDSEGNRIGLHSRA